MKLPATALDTDRELARALFDLLPRIGKVAQRAARERGVLTFERSRILWPLSQGPRRAGELAQLCRLAPSGVTELVEALVDEGLVRREDDPDDRRAVVIALTAQGRRELQRFQDRVADVLAEVIGHLEPAKRERLRAALGDLRRAFDQNQP